MEAVVLKAPLAEVAPLVLEVALPETLVQMDLRFQTLPKETLLVAQVAQTLAAVAVVLVKASIKVTQETVALVVLESL